MEERILEAARRSAPVAEVYSEHIFITNVAALYYF